MPWKSQSVLDYQSRRHLIDTNVSIRKAFSVVGLFFRL
jgi:hypothetical protein